MNVAPVTRDSGMTPAKRATGTSGTPLPGRTSAALNASRSRPLDVQTSSPSGEGSAQSIDVAAERSSRTNCPHSSPRS